MKDTYKDISTYGVIGNLQTCALVGRDGSIDWLCFPYLESSSVFGALLDSARGGMFRITPEMRYESANAYMRDTNILQTRFVTPTGEAVLTDFMPVATESGGARCMVVRKAEGVRGMCWLRVTLQPRFDYGRTEPVFSVISGDVCVTGGPEALFLQAPSGIDWVIRDGTAEGTVALRKGQTLWFVLTYNERTALSGDDCRSLLDGVTAYWRGWVGKYLDLRGVFDEPWREVVIRSGLVLKLLMNPWSGAVVAAATTSLPERSGGIRNWDYRFAWMRDSSFTVQALYHLGDISELNGYTRWIRGVVKKARDVSALRAVYAVHDQRDIREVILDSFEGYRGAGPVRIGNAAVEQCQLDIYGELVNAIYEPSRYGAGVSPGAWGIIRNIVDHVCRIWCEPDNGIWEFRGPPRHFVHSKLMCWVAVDRGIRTARMKGYDAPLSSWMKAREAIRSAILSEGYDASRNTFVQSFGSRALDAATLLIPVMGLLPFDDPRVRGTIQAVRDNLVVNDCLVYRYLNDDGLPGREGCFGLCSFWLVKVLALSGRMEEAEDLFMGILRYMSPLGLFAEEIDPVTGRQLGNFPQAFSHIGLINASLYMGLAKGKARSGPVPTGVGAAKVRQKSGAGRY